VFYLIVAKNPSTYNNIMVDSYQEKKLLLSQSVHRYQMFISKIPPLICNKSRTLLLMQPGLWALTKAWELARN